jgi:hypothetical protein
MLTSTLDEELLIYYRRSTNWIALGRFDQAMEDDDECEWQMSDNRTHELHLLLVSLSSELCFGTNFIYQSSYDGPIPGSHYVPSTISKSSIHISTPVPSGSGEVSSLSERQIDFMTSLDMDKGLVAKKGSISSLEMIWKRYVAIQKAISDVGNIDWESGVKKPSQSEIISVYSGKSTFYEQSKVLQHIKIHPNMVEWLERTESNMDATTEIWGFYKAIYSVKDLEKWLKTKNEEAEKVKGKGKGKKGKGKVTDLSPSVKRVHKKSGVVHKQ